MKTNYLMKRIGSAIFALTLLLGIGIATSSTAQAQWQNNDQWRRNRDNEREQRRRERQNARRQRRGGYGNNGGYSNDGYGNYGGSFDLRQTALNAGFADGAKEGRKDRSRNERHDYTDESDFQKATRDYSSRLGDRSLYQRYYREAFANGYDDGYNGY
jgi:hypothetical protein